MINQTTQTDFELEHQESINILPSLTPEEQRRKTLERLYVVNGIGSGTFLETIKSYYYLTIGYFTDYPKYKLYWEITEFLYEKKYGKKYGD